MATRVKTLRLPEDVIETVEGFPGDSFTDKFVSAVRLLGRDREKLEKQLKELEHERQQKYAALADMGKLLRKRDDIRRGLDDVGWRLSEVSRMCRAVEGVVQDWTSSDTSYNK